MGSPGLTLTQHPPESPISATADAPPSTIWERLTDAGLLEEVERAVDDLVGHLRAGRRGFALETMGVSALDGLYASVMGSLVDADPIKSARTKQARRLITEFGAAERSAVGLHAPLSSLVDGPIAVLQASDRTPTVSIKVDDEFGALRVEQREEIVQKILAPLAQAVDLRLIATGRWQRKLVKEYHTSLPGVSDRDIAHPYASQGKWPNKLRRHEIRLIPTVARRRSSDLLEVRRAKPRRITHSTLMRRCLTRVFDSVLEYSPITISSQDSTVLRDGW